MIKVLMVVKALEKNGVTSVLMSYFQNIDKTRFQVDLVTGTLYDELYKRQIEDCGGEFYVIADRDKNITGYINELAKIVSVGGYDIVHVHGNSSLIFPELMAAKKGGARVRIAHSHNTMCNHPSFNKVVWPIFRHYYTHGVACSKEAGEWMFRNREFTIISNGIDTERFAFSTTDRVRVRRELNIAVEELLVGHVGYFNYQKNHTRLIKILEKIKGQNPKAKLLLVGDGGERPNIEKQVEEAGLSDSVIFYGLSDNVPALLSAMDVFVLPSHFEGFAIVLIEAQASGLECVTSSIVPADAADAVIYMELNQSDERWAETIAERATLDVGARERASDVSRRKMRQRGFDVKGIVLELEKYYTSALAGEY